MTGALVFVAIAGAALTVFVLLAMNWNKKREREAYVDLMDKCPKCQTVSKLHAISTDRGVISYWFECENRHIQIQRSNT